MSWNPRWLLVLVVVVLLSACADLESTEEVPFDAAVGGLYAADVAECLPAPTVRKRAAGSAVNWSYWLRFDVADETQLEAVIDKCLRKHTPYDSNLWDGRRVRSDLVETYVEYAWGEAPLSGFPIPIDSDADRVIFGTEHLPSGAIVNYRISCTGKDDNYVVDVLLNQSV